VGGKKLVATVVVAIVVVAVIAALALSGFRPLMAGPGGGPPGNVPPVASFTITPSSVFVGDPVTVNASDSRDPDGEITLYEWDWTSDGTYDSTGVTTTHTYETPGSFTIGLRVTDNGTARATDSRPVTVSERPGEVKILSHGMYIDTIGYAHVVGEVQWTGSRNVAFVELTATFRDSGGTVVAVGFTYTSVSILTPSQKSPFEILEGDNVPRISSYTLAVTAFNPTTQAPYRSFAVHGDSMYEDGIGYKHVVGTVTNTGSSTARYVQVIITFRDGAGNAVATAFTFTSPTDLDPGASGSFEALHSSGSSWGPIIAYDLQVDV
jgi:PKD repeat protein